MLFHTSFIIVDHAHPNAPPPLWHDIIYECPQSLDIQGGVYSITNKRALCTFSWPLQITDVLTSHPAHTPSEHTHIHNNNNTLPGNTFSHTSSLPVGLYSQYHSPIVCYDKIDVYCAKLTGRPVLI